MAYLNSLGSWNLLNGARKERCMRKDAEVCVKVFNQAVAERWVAWTQGEIP